MRIHPGLLLAASLAVPVPGFAQDAPAPATPAAVPPASSAPAPRLPVYMTDADRGRAVAAQLAVALPVRPLTITPTVGRPFSADGITTATQLLADGTRVELQTNTRLFRDSAGRVRREQSIVGLTPAALPVVTITDPAAAVSYTLDSRTQTAYRAPLQAYVRSGGMPLPASRQTFSASYRNGRAVVRPVPPTALPRPEGPDDPVGLIPSGTGSRIETLTTQQILGLWATGTRTSVTVAAGMVGNDRPFNVTSERWTWQDLNLVAMTRTNDPRVGSTEYRLTNVVRAEPAASLFVVPAGYRVVDTVAPAAPTAR